MVQSTRLFFQQGKIMGVIEKDAFLRPGPPVFGHVISLMAENYSIHIALDHYGVMSKAHRDRIIVVIEPNQ
jgi:exosome complex RNA-binding protein Csl4